MFNKNSEIGVLIVLVAVLSACGAGMDDATRIARAEQSAAQEEYREAAIELKNVLQNDPANIEARVLLGKVSLEAGDASTAAKELQRARELGAEPRDYAVPLARAMLALGNADAVLDFQPEDLGSPDDRADLNAILGNAHLRKNEVGEAERRFESALSDQAGHADALIGMARVQLDRGDEKAAEDSLRGVIAQHSDEHAAYGALGQLLMKRGEYAPAEENFRTALTHAGKPALAGERLGYLANLIDALLAQKKTGEAQVIAAQMLDLAPEHPYSLFQAARTDFASGRMDSTIERTQRVITAFPDYQPARLLLAAAAMSKENFALAEIHLRSIVSSDPDNARARQLMAQAQMKMGSPEAAIDALAPLLEGDSVDPRLLAIAGSASLRSGDTEKGLDYLARGLESGGSDPAIQMQAATSYIAGGQIDKAIELLEQMPESMHDEKRDFMLVLARLQSGDIEGARKQAQQLLDQRPGDPVAHRIMGGFHMAVQENDLARIQFEKVYELDPTDTGTVVNLARLDAIEGNLASAEDRYKKLLEQEPGSLAALLGLSQLAEKGGDQAAAVELLEQARAANPDAAQPALLLARYYLRTAKPDLAMERANQALDAAPSNVQAMNLVGLVQIETGRQSEALKTLERSLQHEPNRAETHFYLAQAQMKVGMNEAGRKSLEKTLELEPMHLGSRIALSRMDIALGQTTAGLDRALSLRDDYPDRAEPEALLGDIHIMRGYYNDAIEAYDRAGEILPNETMTLKRYEARQRAGRANAYKVLEQWLDQHGENPTILVVLGQAYQAEGLTEKAVSAYERTLEKAPDNVVALNNLAWLYAELGGDENLQRGIEIARQAHDKLPDVGEVTDTYGWLLLKQGKIDVAIDTLRQAVGQARENRDVRYHLAVALQRNGDTAEARDLLDEMLSDGRSFSSRDEAKALRNKL